MRSHHQLIIVGCALCILRQTAYSQEVRIAMNPTATKLSSETARLTTRSEHANINDILRTFELVARVNEIHAKNLGKQIADIQQLVNSGSESPSALLPLESQLAEVQARSAEDTNNLLLAKLTQNLSSDCKLEIKDATLTNVLEALHAYLSDAIVNENPDTKFTISAENAPLGAILEAIADQGNLCIDLTDGKIVIRPHAKLKVNGSDVPIASPASPWGLSWGVNAPEGVKNFKVTWTKVVETLTERLRDKALLGTLISKAPDMPSIGPLTTITNVTRLTDSSFVVAERGVNAQGEQGLWITVYKKVNSKLVKDGPIFHPYNQQRRKNP